MEEEGCSFDDHIVSIFCTVGLGKIFNDRLTQVMICLSCQNTDLNDVLGRDYVCQLSQPIKLCLMEQLGTDLVRTDNINVTL